MVRPSPIGSKKQVQRMVTTLKNICRDYPARGTVLRELLQNADDAGATEVKFVLDERHHPTDPLLHEHLARYQGPALLAYNNSLFKEEDFVNLTHTGDSYKLDDASTTGRFGRGFNSVYNWTDSPSIVSRDQLLILDPHEWWSAPIVSPLYDFVTACNEPEIQNQMQAYTSITEEFSQPFDGTIIRIPLRTEQQAKESDIIDTETTVEEIRDVLQSFAAEFGDSGLLFLRNVEKLSIETTSGFSASVGIVNLEAVRAGRSLIKSALKAAAQDHTHTFEDSFHMDVQYDSGVQSKTVKYATHHRVSCRPSEESFAGWIKKQKIVPWVAVAARLEPVIDLTGTLFTVLSLPIPTAQPVHIHGLFSVSPDRARLVTEDRNITDSTPAKWNKFLFETSVPTAWATLLEYISINYPRRSTFDWWPRTTDDDRDPLEKAVKLVVESISQRELCVFPTIVGYRSANHSILANGHESASLKNALEEAKLPVVYVSNSIRSNLRGLFLERYLCPIIVCEALQTENEQIRNLRESTKTKILDFLITDSSIVGLENLELFPFEDGTYRSVSEMTAFIHRDEFERQFFRPDAGRNIDLTKVLPHTKTTLETYCTVAPSHPSFRHRKTEDFVTFCQQALFQEADKREDVISTELSTEILSQAWKWIANYAVGLLDTVIVDLWLLPFGDGSYRKIMPNDQTLILSVPLGGEIGKLCQRLDSDCATKASRLLDVERMGLGFQDDALRRVKAMRQFSSLRDLGNLVDFAEWLQQNAHLVAESSREDRRLILKHLSTELKSDSNTVVGSSISAAVSTLEIFERVKWQEYDGEVKMILSWTRLEGFANSIGTSDRSIPLVEIDNCQFLLAEPGSDAYMILKALDIKSVRCLDTVSIIERFIIPNMTISKSTFAIKVQVGKVLLRLYSSLSKEAQIEMSNLPFVPVDTIGNQGTSKLAAPSTLLDPDNLELTGLFFDDNELLPKKDLHEKYGTALKLCGMKIELDCALILRLVAYLAQEHRPISEVIKRVHLLLSQGRWRGEFSASDQLMLKTTAWLPIRDPTDGSFERRVPKYCRGFDDWMVCGFVIPVLQIQVTKAWKDVLGWHSNVPTDILIRQLVQGLAKGQSSTVDAVLKRIYENGDWAAAKASLQSKAFVLMSDGHFQFPTKAFLSGCDGLGRYLGNVDRMFWDKHRVLLSGCGVRNRPDSDDINEVQAQLEAVAPLIAEEHINVAINLSKLAAKLDRNLRAKFKILAADGNFYLTEGLKYPNVKHLAEDEDKVTHPIIGMDLAQSLGIELLSEHHLKGLLDIADADDDDEFDQREQVTTRIRDTLDRYPVNTTFREYLANADDAHASKISWLLDERDHPADSLLTPEMADLQGPALLVHNDSVFSDADIRGFKSVGEGSKRLDSATIGQFGRGSQTMFHWTDVPMILSGEFLIILDPQQNVLPMNQRRGQRKPGVKLLLKTLRQACPGHLRLFEHLWDYSTDLETYHGTIFRFPLRSPGTKSKLVDSGKYLHIAETRRLLSNYLEEARISLLFLNNVSSIEYKIHGKKDPGWLIHKLKDELRDAPNATSALRAEKCITIEHIACSVRVATASGCCSGVDSWRVARSNVDHPSANLYASQSRVAKNPECGVAALVSSEASSDEEEPLFAEFRPLAPQVFSTLPLSIASRLPVHIHATFSLTGDRRTLADEAYGSSKQDPLNNHFIEVALPELYLALLENLASTCPQKALKFWPQSTLLSGNRPRELVDALMGKLPKSPRALYLPAEPSQTETNSPLKPLTFENAVFNTQKKDVSGLVELLVSVGIPLVKDLPLQILSYLNQNDRTAKLTEARVRKHFTSLNSRGLLKNAMSVDPTIFDKLLGLALGSKEDLDQLDSTCFIRLASGDLGILRVENIELIQKVYLLATEHEISLFGFASDVLVLKSHWRSFPEFGKGKYTNIGTLDFKYIPKLFENRGDLTAVCTPKWLTSFWIYWKSRVPDDLQSSLGTLPVCLASCRGLQHNKKLSELSSLPAVVEPVEPSHRRLCDRFPGLWTFNAVFLPTQLSTKENSFTKRESFYRFIMALKNLCPKQQSLGEFVQARLLSDDLKDFCKLAISHIPEEPEISYSLFNFQMLKSAYATLRLWPSCDSKSKLLPASDAIIIENHTSNALLAPWMKDYSRFISNHAHTPKLVKLGAKFVSTDVVLDQYIFPLPGLRCSTDWDHYLRLISWLDHYSGNFSLSTLRTQKVAVDQNLLPRDINQLFDHEDQLFLAAFRNDQDAKFLHQRIRKHRRFWLRLGLQQNENNLLKSSTYIQCLESLLSRLLASGSPMDQQLIDDSKEVLSPLISSTFRTQQFSAWVWNHIAQFAIFRSETDNRSQPPYRSAFMRRIAIERPFLNLREIVSADYLSACWSQIPFAVLQPTIEVMRHFNGGKPSTLTVWAHLLHLKKISVRLELDHISDFLQDLQKTYKFLQENDCAEISQKGSSEAVWLNIATFEGHMVLLDDVKNRWVKAQNLVLSSSCDAGPIKAVKAGLMRFRNLLEKMGCHAVTYPTVESPALQEGHSISKALRTLRDEGKLLDVEYLTEGESIKAHRVVLAAVSEFCATNFNQKWISSTRNIIKEGVLIIQCNKFDVNGDEDESFLSYSTLRMMIDYCYNGEINWTDFQFSSSDETSLKQEKLQELLDLLRGADFWLIPSLRSQVEVKILSVGRELITIANVEETEDWAANCNAVTLEKYCQEFRESNRAVIDGISPLGEDTEED